MDEQDRTGNIASGKVVCFAPVWNELLRPPCFLDHHRRLGVGHFLVVDNVNQDGKADHLAAQSDTSVWTTPDRYMVARFGFD